MLHWLGIEPSYSRPRVSDDNPYAEALFRTAKYRAEFPVKGFAGLDAAREWTTDFVHWYNDIHRHSGIQYVTPAQRHAGQDRGLLASRHELYQQARQANPRRWTRQTRDWTPVTAVTLNPERDIRIQTASPRNQLSGSAKAPAFPSRPDNASAMARNAGEERSTAARSHAQRPLRREHGEDGAHRNFPEVSTMAHSGSARGPCHRRASGQMGGAG
jgi:putative transposase